MHPQRKIPMLNNNCTPAATTVKKRRRKLDLRPLIKGCVDLHHSLNLQRRSLNELTRQLEDFRSWCRIVGIRKLEDITGDLLKSFLEQNVHRGKTHIKLAVWALRIFGGYLAVMDHLPDSPAKNLSHPKFPYRRKLPEYLRPQELEDFTGYLVDQRPLLEQAVILLMLNAGLRPKEVVLLRPQDVNPLRRIVAITVKGGWKRILPISTVLSEILEEYLQQYAILPASVLFSNEWDRPIDVRWIERLTHRIAAGAGINRRITPRMLRHTFATYMAERNGKRITKMFLGHGASKSTDTYIHVLPGKYRQYMNMHPFQTDPQGDSDND